MTSNDRKFLRLRVIAPLLVLLLAILLLPGASLYYSYSGGKSCTRCHEIWQPYRDWHESAHRNVACSECHGDVLTLDAGFHLKNLRQLAAHLRGEIPEQVRLKTDDVLKIEKRCEKCHRQEYADWSAGPHSATYSRIFLDKDHNQHTLLMDDCLRCHGMHFQGSIRDLVTPLDTHGPWRLLDPQLADRPSMPCLTCHQMHRHGEPLARPATKADDAGPRQEISRPSLALFDRREQDYVSPANLPLPQMHDGARLIRISPDQRQALCYQCHAPTAGGHAGSGDDRTPLGVHEGLSCLACHEKHGQTTRASCATCHPQLSNCGLDVEKMDTTFKSLKSPHNIHTVKCADCHTNGIPKKRTNNHEGHEVARRKPA
ncbi:MAG TPA: multiheme c-type cytochrome [Candidatus Dormibacteraeota bacterium]|nr:multiheme c-type cytochrome [Candidatus Dormibacteraeota bacterium]